MDQIDGSYSFRSWGGWRKNDDQDHLELEIDDPDSSGFC
jgi:hypothetical protein